MKKKLGGSSKEVHGYKLKTATLNFSTSKLKARTWKTKIDEIKGTNNVPISGQNQLKSTAKLHFENLYTEDGEGDIDAQESLLKNIPKLINEEDNEYLYRKSLKWKSWAYFSRWIQTRPRDPMDSQHISTLFVLGMCYILCTSSSV
jgi:hypothetical protein